MLMGILALLTFIITFTLVLYATVIVFEPEIFTKIMKKGEEEFEQISESFRRSLRKIKR